MNQRKLSRVLMLAGGMALAGVIFLFYGMAVFYLLSHVSGMGAVISIAQMALGLPYLFALNHYFRICKNIGDDRSFCRENAKRMDAIAKLLFLAAALWVVAAVLVALLGGAGELSGYGTAPFGALALYVRMGLALLASLAVGLVAKMMALLVGRATRLQEENDLTI